jgi:arabinogalactan oligomer/maltooligosaccharide transport system permease protein
VSSIASDARARPSDARPAGRGLAGALLHPAALATLLGAALAVGLSWWFSSQARQELAEDAWNRGVIMQLSAVAEATAGLEARGGEEAEEALGRFLPDLQAEGGSFRVLRQSGARLLASTDPADSGDSAAPRRLSRDEKWLFDLAQGLRSAVQTNRQEGVVRRRQVEIDPLGESQVRVSLPYFVEGEVAGIVLAERERRLDFRPPSTVTALVAVAGAWLLMAGIVALRRRRAGPPDPAARNWGLCLAGVFLVAAAGWLWGGAEINAIRGWQAELAAGLAENFQSLEQRIGLLAGSFDLSVSPGEENRWDTDLYQRPLGIIGADGTLRTAELALQADALAVSCDRRWPATSRSAR